MGLKGLFLVIMVSILQLSETKLHQSPRDNVREDQIKRYCSKIHTALENVIVVYKFFNSAGTTCRDFNSWCLESTVFPKLIQSNFDDKAEAGVLFYNNFSDYSTIINQIAQVQDHKPMYHIIFCSEMDDDKVTVIAKKIWAKKKLPYFVMVYISNDLLQVTSYDGYAFGSPNLNFTSNYEHVFARRPKSLDNPVVILVPTYPVTVEVDGKPQGEYIELIEALETCLKTGLTKQFNNVVENLSAGNIRYVFNSVATVVLCIKPILYDVNDKYFITSPIDVEDVVVLVPIEKAKNEFYYIFSIMTYKTVICFFVLLITMSFLNKNLTLGYNLFSYSDVFFDYFGSFLGLPIEKFDVKRSVMVLSWLTFSLIVTVQFKGIFFNEIFNMEHEHKINTLEELKAKKIKIYISLEMQNLQHHDNVMYLGDQIQFVDSLYVRNSIINNSNHAFAVTETVAKGFLNLHVQHKITFNYRVMDEMLASFFMARVVSPTVLDDINSCILRATDAGVQKSSFVSWPKYAPFNDNKMLTSIHFVGAFILLFIGYLISLLAFVVELIMYRLKLTKEQKPIHPYVN